MGEPGERGLRFFSWRERERERKRRSESFLIKLLWLGPLGPGAPLTPGPPGSGGSPAPSLTACSCPNLCQLSQPAHLAGQSHDSRHHRWISDWCFSTEVNQPTRREQKEKVCLETADGICIRSEFSVSSRVLKPVPSRAPATPKQLPGNTLITPQPNSDDETIIRAAYSQLSGSCKTRRKDHNPDLEAEGNSTEEGGLTTSEICSDVY
ncbi:hypothetical protein JZ751_023727, partial [Albula glossodonta]